METKQVKQAAREATERAGRKTTYTPPQVEIIEMEVEGTVMMDSSAGGTAPGFGDGGSLNQNTSTYRSYNSASGSELEDLINDILTVEQ